MHLNMVKGDAQYAAWDGSAYKKYRKYVHELRTSGYRKVQQYNDHLNMYEVYRKGKKKNKLITITILCL
ncbi:hypothetical protein [Bacillus phage Nachito]|nr:hypothetical protein [Bacillus phage Nachito]